MAWNPVSLNTYGNSKIGNASGRQNSVKEICEALREEIREENYPNIQN